MPQPLVKIQQLSTDRKLIKRKKMKINQIK